MPRPAMAWALQKVIVGRGAAAGSAGAVMRSPPSWGRRAIRTPWPRAGCAVPSARSAAVVSDPCAANRHAASPYRRPQRPRFRARGDAGVAGPCRASGWGGSITCCSTTSAPKPKPRLTAARRPRPSWRPACLGGGGLCQPGTQWDAGLDSHGFRNRGRIAQFGVTPAWLTGARLPANPRPAVSPLGGQGRRGAAA